MKVKVLRPYLDLEAGCERKAEDVFECTKERFESIKQKLPEWVEAVEDAKPTKTTRKTTRKTASK